MLQILLILPGILGKGQVDVAVEDAVGHFQKSEDEAQSEYTVRIIIYCFLAIAFIFGLAMLFKKIFYDRDTRQEIEKLEFQLGNAMNQLRNFDLERKNDNNDDEIPESANIDLNDSDQVSKYMKQIALERKMKNAIFIILLEEQKSENPFDDMDSPLPIFDLIY